MVFPFPPELSLELENIERRDLARAVLFYESETGERLYALIFAKGKQYWRTPGGKIEDGFTPLQGAFEEINEETGIAKDTLEVIVGVQATTEYETIRKGEPVVSKVTMFAVRTDQRYDLVVEKEHYSNWGWFTEDEVRQRLTKYKEQGTFFDCIMDQLTYLDNNSH